MATVCQVERATLLLRRSMDKGRRGAEKLREKKSVLRARTLCCLPGRARLVITSVRVVHYGMPTSLRPLSRFPPSLFTWLEGKDKNV